MGHDDGRRCFIQQQTPRDAGEPLWQAGVLPCRVTTPCLQCLVPQWVKQVSPPVQHHALGIILSNDRAGLPHRAVGCWFGPDGLFRLHRRFRGATASFQHPSAGFAWTRGKEAAITRSGRSEGSQQLASLGSHVAALPAQHALEARRRGLCEAPGGCGKPHRERTQLGAACSSAVQSPEEGVRPSQSNPRHDVEVPRGSKHVWDHR